VTDDPVGRLKAGLDKDEASAREAGARSWSCSGETFYAGTDLRYRDPIGETWQSERGIDDNFAAHIARQDPGRTLRRVAAHRKILARYEQATNGDLPEWQAGRELLVAATAILRGVITDLAAAYGDDDA
jgi:Family of unknown function (DUF6221)